MPEANIKVTPTFRFRAICNFQAQNIGSMRTRISDTALKIVLILFTTEKLIKQWPGTVESQIFALGAHGKALRNTLMKHQIPLTHITNCIR